MMKPESRSGVGASSILLIMVVLCLTAFGVLTLVSARVDQKLTERTRNYMESYYAADARAQELISGVDAALAGGEDPLKLAGVSRSGNTIVITVPMEEGQSLLAELALTGPASGTRYQLVKYCVENTGDWGGGAAPSAD